MGVTSLSVFGGNFVLAKVRRGLISVRCSELRGVRFSEVRGQVSRPLYRGCPLFGGSVIRGFTVHRANEGTNKQEYRQCLNQNLAPSCFTPNTVYISDSMGSELILGGLLCVKTRFYQLLFCDLVMRSIGNIYVLCIGPKRGLANLYQFLTHVSSLPEGYNF